MTEKSEFNSRNQFKNCSVRDVMNILREPVTLKKKLTLMTEKSEFNARNQFKNCSVRDVMNILREPVMLKKTFC